MLLEEISNPETIVESDDYGRKLYFDYQKTRGGKELLSSPSPIVLYLGTWRMTDKQGEKKTFICGLNLAYLEDEEELAAVRQALPDILKTTNMKTRYRVGSTLLPDVFSKAYRTYNINNVVSRPIRGRLHILKTSDEDKEEAKDLATQDGREWKDMDNQERNQYLDQAVRKRGSEDIKRQEKSKKEREQIDTYVQKKTEPEPKKEVEEEPPEPSKPEPPAPAPLPKIAKKTPQPTFKPLELGPGYEVPTPKQEPPLEPPTDNVQTGLANPQRVKVKRPEPEPEWGDDETKLP